MDSSIIKIAKTLRNRFLDEPQTSNEISIFLCGGNSTEESKYRRELGAKISKIASKYRYSVYYPEDMFIELILGHQKQDLLTLENLLADGVNAVVILLQSPGTFTELGAFTNYKNLNDKLIVVVDPRFARSKSFINLGPIRYLKKNTKSKVLLLSMNSSNLDNLAKQVAVNARDIAKHSSPIRNLSNPVSGYRFYLALIYIFDPLPKGNVFKISRAIASDGENTLITVAETVINSLINERKVSLSSDKLSVTSKGIDNLIYADQTRKKARSVSEFLTGLRLEALNLTLRRRYNKIWGEAE